MSKTNNIISKHFAQVVLIVFSVVLGLYLSERIEDQKNKRESANLLDIIKSEVNDNRKLMEEWSPYHQAMPRKLDSLSRNEDFVAAFAEDKTVLFGSLFTRSTFMPRLPSSDAWDIGKSHPLIVNIDYDKLLILSKIYNQQPVVFESMYKIFEVLEPIMTPSGEEAVSDLVAVQGRLQEYAAREAQLMEYYEEAIEALGLAEL